jgi:hypothetical protein
MLMFKVRLQQGLTHERVQVSAENNNEAMRKAENKFGGEATRVKRVNHSVER